MVGKFGDGWMEGGMEGRGDGETGRWGDGEMGRLGEVSGERRVVS